MREPRAYLSKLAPIVIVALLVISAAITIIPRSVSGQGSPTVTGVGPWTQVGDYGSSSTTPGQGGIGTLGASCVVYNSYVYCVGGQNPQGTDISDVFYAQLTAGGIGAWTETTDYGATTGSSGTGGMGVEWPSCVESEGYVYCVAGVTNSGIVSKVYYAQLSSSGVGPWTETTDYGAASGINGSGGIPSFQVSCVTDSGYIYCVGNSSFTSKVFFAQLTSSGVGPWTETTDYGAKSGSSGTGGVPIGSTACVENAGYIYCIGGFTTNYVLTSDVFSAPVSSSGVGAWTENEDYGSNSTSNGTGGEPIYGTACVVYFSYVICFGGDTTGNVGTAHVFFAQDQEILGWYQTEDGRVPTYWDDCEVEVIYGYVFCLGQDSPFVYIGDIDTPSTTTPTTPTTPTTETTPTTPTTTTPTVYPTTISTIFTPGAAFAGYQQITAGVATADDAMFTSPVPPPRPTGGNVTYYSYSGPNCTGTKTVLDTVDVRSSSQIPPAPDLTFNTPGAYYFSAHYSGDPTASPADSSCEKLVVVPATTSTTSTSSSVTSVSTVSPPNNDVLIGVGVIVIVAAAGSFFLWTRTRKGKAPPPPTQPPPPPPPPPPPTQPPLVAAPVVIPRDPCPPGSEPDTYPAFSETVELLLPGDARVDISGAYSFGEEDVEAAIKGLERFEKGVLVASVLQGLTGVGEALSGVIEHFTTGAASGAGAKGTTRLSEEVKEAKSMNGDMTVTCPRAKFSVECLITKECVNGYWRVTNRTLNMRMLPDKLPPAIYPPSEYGGPVHVSGAGEIQQQLRAFQNWVNNIKNRDAIAKIKACQEKCQKAQ